MIRIFGENMEENGVKESTLSRNHGTDIKDRRPIERMFPPEQKGAAAYDVYAFESKSIAAPCEFRGLGNRLLKTSINFCREKGDSKRTLDILEPARHLYAKFGFHKTESKAYNEWNESREMYHETWECELE